MATVSLAEDLKHHRPVAIKVLHPELAAALGTERFLREIEIASWLQHPHILPLYDSGAAAGSLYYVMPYVEGESLRGRLEREKMLPLPETLRITSEVASALTYAHSHRVIHRDIKPENILLMGETAVVADFGIARAITAAGDTRLTQTGTVIGTPTYMSPEQAMGAEDIDGRSDQYSLACVVYEMLTGEPPFTGSTAQAVIARHSLDAVSPPSIVRDTIPEGVEDAVLRGLSKVPADRFPTAALFAEALLSAPPTVSARRRTSRAVLPAHRRRGLYVGGILLGVVLYRHSGLPRDSIARALNAGSLIEGSVEERGDRLVASVRLIDGTSGADIERGSFEHPRGNPLQLRDTLAQQVAAFLRRRLGEELVLREQKAGTESVGAWILLQQGEKARKDADSLAAAGDVAGGARLLQGGDSLLVQAEALDRKWAEPLVLRAAIAYRRSRLVGARAPLQAAPWIDRGLTLAAQALQLDPQNARALELRGTLRYWRWLLHLAPDPKEAAALLQDAERDLRAAVGLTPSLASAWSTLSHLDYQKNDITQAKIDAQRAYEEDAYLRVADQVVWRLFSASYSLEQTQDAVHWCAEGRTEQAPHHLVCHAQIGVLFVGALRVDLCLGDVVLLIIEMAQGAPGARERGCEPDRRPEIPFRVLQQRGGLLGVGCQVQEPAPITQRAPELERAGVLRVELQRLRGEGQPAVDPRRCLERRARADQSGPAVGDRSAQDERLRPLPVERLGLHQQAVTPLQEARATPDVAGGRQRVGVLAGPLSLLPEKPRTDPFPASFLLAQHELFTQAATQKRGHF